MFISNSRDFIYFHVPKCGGNSITKALTNSSRFVDLPISNIGFGHEIFRQYHKKYKIWKHSSVSQIKELLGPQWRKYKKFAFVRSPYERTKSLFKYFNKYPEQKQHKQFSLESLKSFISCQAFRNGQYISAPISSFLDTDLESIRIIKLENITDEWPDLNDWLGLPYHELKVFNQSKSMSLELDPEDIQIIEEVYSNDFESFAYNKTHE